MSFLFVDRICQSQPGKHIVGIKQVRAADTYLSQDNQGKPVFIPALVGETLGQLAAWNVMQANDFSLRPVAGVVAEVDMLGQAYVGDVLILHSYIEQVDEHAVQYHSQAMVGERPICTLQGAIGPMLPTDTFINPTVVRQQFAAIYQPGPIPQLNLNPAHDPTTPQIWQPADIDSIMQQETDYLWIQKQLDPHAAYFADHFPRKPVLPLTLLLHSNVELGGQWVTQLLPEGRTASACKLRKIKMRDFVHPQSTLDIHLRVKQLPDHFIVTCRSEIAGRPVCVCEVHYAY